MITVFWKSESRLTNVTSQLANVYSVFTSLVYGQALHTIIYSTDMSVNGLKQWSHQGRQANNRNTAKIYPSLAAARIDGINEVEQQLRSDVRRHQQTRAKPYLLNRNPTVTGQKSTGFFEGYSTGTFQEKIEATRWIKNSNLFTKGKQIHSNCS
jgi:hypothetical protein